MFILNYISATLLTSVFLMTSFFSGYWWLFLLSSCIFALLYTNLIIMCKYSAIFIKKTIKKEILTQNEIYLLITSLVIFVTVGVVLTLKQDINLFSAPRTRSIGETIMLLISGYIILLIMVSESAITALSSLEFADFFLFIPMAIVMWINIFILGKYLYLIIRKTIKKKLPTQKEIIYLITSMIFFFIFGVMGTMVMRV